MEIFICTLLAISVLSVESISENSNVLRKSQNNPETWTQKSYFDINNWLKKAETRQAFYEAWGGPDSALSKAYNISQRTHTSSRMSSRCQEDVDYLLNSGTLATYNMLDSSVKIPEGLLALSWTHFGNWQQCVNVRGVTSPGGSFNGKMCMVKIQPTLVSTSHTNEISTNKDLHVRTGNIDAGMLPMLLAYISINLGECLPSTCSAEDVEILFRPLVDSLPALGPVKMAATVSENDCTTLDKPSFDAVDWVAVSILIVLGVLVVLSTSYDVLVPDSRKRTLYAAFSVVSNGRKLLAAPRLSGDQTLSCLHGIRFLSMAWVVVGHRYMNAAGAPSINQNSFRSGMFDDWYRIGLTNATVSVDTFFVLSGLLVGYLFFKQTAAKRKLNIPLYYIHRYIRLTPALAMMALFYASLLSRVGWGPIWRSTIEESREGCRENWWAVLLYIGNYVGVDKQCVSQSWYLMVDMQLHWLSPIALLLLARKPRLGMVVLFSLCGASLIANFVYSYVEDIPGASSAVGTDAERLKFHKFFYIPTYIRFSTYLEGILVGYYLGNERMLGNKPRKLNCIVKCLAWLLISALLLVPLFTGMNIVQYPGIDKLPTAFFNSLHRPAWGLGIAGVVYMCATGNCGPVNTLLSWYGFQILGRFSYCVYLTHMAIQLIQVGTMKTVGYLSDSTILTQFAGDLLMSYIFGGILSLLCESPFLILEKELLGRFQKKDNDSNAGQVKHNASTTVLPMAIPEDKSLKSS